LRANVGHHGLAHAARIDRLESGHISQDCDREREEKVKRAQRIHFMGRFLP